MVLFLPVKHHPLKWERNAANSTKGLSSRTFARKDSQYGQEVVSIHNQAISSCVGNTVPYFSFVSLTERLWLSPGSVNGGRHAGGMLHYGTSMVCGCHSPLHHSCQQPEAGVRMFRSRRTTQISRHQRTAGDWAHDFYSYGFISFYDQCSEVYPHACVIWSVSLHGCFISKRNSVI